ncbi:DUF881 domain-containing protein [Nocardioides nanhaiensis]|uniref:DUF881 domain-containing protein n=1 Tax=Nocardioides nanhaiensis TaxID=1476871 RepID=A0ABP8WP05_9ACTN
MPEHAPEQEPEQEPEPVAGPTAGPPDPASGRARLRHALLAPTQRQVVVALLLALLGFAVVTQVRDNQVDDSYAGLRQQDLIDVLSGLSGARQRAEAERTRLERLRDDLQSDTSRRQAALQQAETEADALAILGGLVPVTGSGVRIVISEETGRVRLGSLLDVVQELRTVGAEAIAVNGEVRVVAQTSFEEVEGGFLIDGEVLEPPYVIDVIGEPALLSEAISFIDGPARAIRRDGGEVTVEELSSLDIEAVREPVTPEFAEEVPGE